MSRQTPRRVPKARIVTILCGLVCAIILAWFYRDAIFNNSGAGSSIQQHVEVASIVGDLVRLRQAAAVLDPEMMAHAPDKYDTNYKNPCWTAKDGQLACLPYVYITGFSSGSGALIKQMQAHPHVIKDAGSAGTVWGPSWNYWSEYRNKMADYLSDIRGGSALSQALKANPQGIVIDGGLSTFALYWAGSGKAHRAFSTAAVECWAVCDKTHGGSVGPGYEKCMDEVCLPKGRAADYAAAQKAGLDYKRDVHLPLLMRAMYGDQPPRMVLLVRDPVERIISGYFGIKNMWEHYGGKNMAGFQRFVDEQLGGWYTCLNGTSSGGLRGDGGPPGKRTAEDCYLHLETLGMQDEKLFFHGDQLFRGLWAPYLKIWLRFLPASHILVINSEDYFSDPDTTVNRVLGFLSMPMMPPDPHRTQDGAATGGEGVRTLLLLRTQLAHAGTSAATGNSAGAAVASQTPSGRFLDQNTADRVRRAGAQRSYRPPDFGEVPPATRRALAEFYAPFNRQLSEMLGDARILKWSKAP